MRGDEGICIDVCGGIWGQLHGGLRQKGRDMYGCIGEGDGGQLRRAERRCMDVCEVILDQLHGGLRQKEGMCVDVYIYMERLWGQLDVVSGIYIWKGSEATELHVVSDRKSG